MQIVTLWRMKYLLIWCRICCLCLRSNVKSPRGLWKISWKTSHAAVLGYFFPPLNPNIPIDVLFVFVMTPNSFDFLKIDWIYAAEDYIRADRSAVASSRNCTSAVRNFHSSHQNSLLSCPELKYLTNLIHLCGYSHRNNEIPMQPI